MAKLTAVFRPRPLVLALLLCSASSAPVQADINKAVSGLFDGMVSSSPAGKWETQSRGVISGGGMRVRTPIMQEQLMNIQMPSADASCGGIDLFGGSFSFINSDTLSQLGNNIISVGKNYAFKLGLSVVSPKIEGLMADIESVIREMNNLSVNSCEWAQGLMAPGARAIENRLGVDMGLTGQEGQVFDNFFDSFANLGSGSNTETAVSSNPGTSDTYQEMTGNILWNAMQSANAGSWSWVGNGSSNEIMEMIQSVTGTYIVGEITNAGDERRNSPISGQLSLSSFINGGDAEAYLSCDDYQRCANPTVSTQAVTGLATRIEEVLIGSGGGGGAVAKFNSLHSASASHSQAEIDLMASLPYEFGSYVARLASINEANAEYLVRNYKEFIALEASLDLIHAQLRAARAAIRTIDSAYQQELLDVIAEAADRIEEQRAMYQIDQNLEGMQATYRVLIENADIPRYYLNGKLGASANGTD